MDYYVSPAGSDDGDGSIEHPFATLLYAQTVVRAAIAVGMVDHVRVFLRGGIHLLTASLVFGAEDSGRDGYKVKWLSYPGEQAEISGGTEIAGWTLHEGKIYKASVSLGRDFRSLYVNGLHIQRARGGDDPTGWTRTTTGYLAPDDTMASWENKSSIEIVSCGAWAIQRGKVATIVGNVITMQEPFWTIQQAIKSGWVIPDTPSWIENALELLDVDEEWYLNKTAGLVYYRPTSGSMAGLTVIAPLIEKLIVCDGAANLDFVNLVFEHSNWTGPESGTGYAGNNNYYFTTVPGANDAALPPGAIEIVNSTNITFASADFVHLGSALAIKVLDGNQNVNIAECYFDDIAGGEIQIGNALDCITPSIDVSVTDSYFGVHCFYDFQSCARIASAGSDGLRLCNNTLARKEFRWSDIVLNGYPRGFLNDTVVAYNRINLGVDYLGPLRFADGAPLHLTDPQSQNDTYESGLLVYNNYFDVNGSHLGMYHDFNTAWVTGYHNVVRGTTWNWLYTHWTNVHDLIWTQNYWHNAAEETYGDRITVEDNTRILTWPVPVGSEQEHIQIASGVAWGVRPGADKTRAPLYDSGAGDMQEENEWPVFGN